MSGIMPRGTRQILLPASPAFIWLSLLAALLCNMLQSFWLGDWSSWTPDYVTLVLAFWSIHQPQRIGIGVAFFLGLLMDVHQATLLGQHAFAYPLLSFSALTLHRRVLWFKISDQAIQLFPLFVGCRVVELLLRMVFGDAWPGWLFILSPLTEVLLWPIVSALLLFPQRRSPDPDLNRPL